MTIVNMPSEQELEEVRQALELRKTKSHDSDATKCGAANMVDLSSAVVTATV